MKFFLVVSVMLIFQILSVANAEMIFLKNGTTVEAMGVWDEGNEYGCFVNGRAMKIKKNEVDKIEDFEPIKEDSSEEIKDIVYMSFHEKLIKEYEYSEPSNEIILVLYRPAEKKYEDYLTERKIYQLFIIEALRLFYKIPDLEKLNLSLEIKNTIFFINQTKSQTVSNYGVSIDLLREYDDKGNIIIGDNWRRTVLNKYGKTKSMRPIFKKHVKVQRK